MGELIRWLRDRGWTVQVWLSESHNHHIVAKRSRTATYIGVDGGETVGLAVVGSGFILTAQKTFGDVQRAIVGTYDAVRGAIIYGEKRRKPIHLGIEAGYCPSHIAVAFAYGLWSAIMMTYSHRVYPFLVQPHRKPPNRTVKIASLKYALFDQDLAHSRFNKDESLSDEVSVGNIQHSVSAFGIIEALWENAKTEGVQTSEETEKG